MGLQTNLKQTNVKNFLICFFIAMGQLAFGYPASVISVTLGQPAFLEYMGLANAQGKVVGNLLNTEGATSGVFQAGAAVGTIVTAIVLDTVMLFEHFEMISMPTRSDSSVEKQRCTTTPSLDSSVVL